MRDYLGEPQATLTVCVEHQPRWPEPAFASGRSTLFPGELAILVGANSNHWRKIFNVYAKLLCALKPDAATDWRALRDQQLFQPGQQHGLRMGSIVAENINENTGLTLIAGKQYADALGLLSQATSLAPGIFVHDHANCLITPYFDYRALSDASIARLAQIMTERWSDQTALVLAT
ncbi:DUF6942 family protein [Reinekea blandensis]|uniref:Uncharacterized protein n=1 Tax=Reinekea blandensis MED297 TaxID=314283 RepID=A4B8U3_9GAMM|nr:hypothetical protein [Reinekea blandensis]EAR11044.1 hypothetical protein MED297_19192 [Reinekea sp. MED297] [Reinekea blandensis MED297]